MSLFLQIVGTVALTLVVLAVLLYAWIASIGRRFMFSSLPSVMAPAFIRLQEGRKAQQSPWPDYMQMAENAKDENWPENEPRHQEFLHEGFSLRGVYGSEEAPCLQLALYTQGGTLMGTLCRAEMQGSWMDVYAYDREGTLNVVSGTYRRWDLRNIPGEHKIHEPGASLQDLLNHACEFDAQALPTETAAMITRLERAYRANQAVLLKAKPDRVEALQWFRELEDVLDPLGDEDKEPGEKEADKFLLSLRYESLSQYRELCAVEALEQGVIDARTWSRMHDRITVIHDREDATGLTGGSTYAEFSKSIRRKLERHARQRPDQLRSIFHEINRKLPTRDRYRLIGTCAEPVEADIYLAPDHGPTSVST